MCLPDRNGRFALLVSIPSTVASCSPSVRSSVRITTRSPDHYFTLVFVAMTTVLLIAYVNGCDVVVNAAIGVVGVIAPQYGMSHMYMNELHTHTGLVSQSFCNPIRPPGIEPGTI